MNRLLAVLIAGHLIAGDTVNYRTQEFPNDNALGIHLDRVVGERGRVILASDQRTNPPIIDALLSVKGVVDVLLEEKLVTVVRRTGLDWKNLLPMVIQRLETFLKVRLNERPPLPRINNFYDIP